jgi:hypothetical protein
VLKKSASIVLGSSKSSTYPRGYASGFDSPAALPDSLFEHPAGVHSCRATRTGHRISRVQHRFSASCYVFLKAYRFADLIQQEGEKGMEPDDLLCSRNARLKKALVGRAGGWNSLSALDSQDSC